MKRIACFFGLLILGQSVLSGSHLLYVRLWAERKSELESWPLLTITLDIAGFALIAGAIAVAVWPRRKV
jgi:hypothetical protein